MLKPPNPITQGLRQVTRDPVIFLVEILWRWSFALLACLLVVAVGSILLGPLHIGPSWDTALRSRDPQRIGSLLVVVLLRLGTKAIMAPVSNSIAISSIAMSTHSFAGGGG